MVHRATGRIASPHRFRRVVAVGLILAFTVLLAANRAPNQAAEGTRGHLVRSCTDLALSSPDEAPLSTCAAHLLTCAGLTSTCPALSFVHPALSFVHPTRSFAEARRSFADAALSSSDTPRSSTEPVRSFSSAASLPADRIRPSAENPRYWSYKGRTVLLIGGSIEDNLFQIDELEHHLDVLVAAGGNYIRNTMSSRDSGNVWPFDRRADGLYDLDRLSNEYFGRFERLLELAFERDIIVQIELWDRFDFAREPWLENPYRPANNATYSAAQSRLADEYPGHPNDNENPFFRTVPANENNGLVLRYQRAQVDRMLDISLRFPNVLYTMDNETNGTPEWGGYWADYILKRAAEEGVEVYTTEMWDDWDIRADQHRHTLDHPQRYGFADISQNNHNSGDLHWDRLQWVRDYVSTHPRPLNNVKIYGAYSGRFGSSRDGIERFWRNVVGGAASARFHRPESGIGLSGAAQTSIRSARLLAEHFDLFRAAPDADGSLLSDREANEAFLSHIPGEAYAVYFPNAGSVSLDLRQATGTFTVHWLDVAWSHWRRGPSVAGGRRVLLKTPDAGHWVIVLRR